MGKLSFLTKLSKQDLKFLEKLGVPKGERNQMTLDQLQALKDLVQFKKSGSKRQIFAVNEPKNTFGWVSKKELSDQNIPFVRWFVNQGKAGDGMFYKADWNQGFGRNGQIRYNPDFMNVSWFTEPMLIEKSGLKYAPGEATMFNTTPSVSEMRLTSPRADIKELIDDLKGSTKPEDIELLKKLENVPTSLDKTTMKDFWIGTSRTQKPGTYLTGDAGTAPLGAQLVEEYMKNKNFVNQVYPKVSEFERATRNGLSPDSYSAIIRQAQREGNDLRWGNGFTNWNDQAVTNKHIFDAWKKYKAKEITAEEYKQIFDDWAIPLGGREAKIVRIPERVEQAMGNDGEIIERVLPEVEKVIIPHPYIYKRKLGGKLIPKNIKINPIKFMQK